MTPTQGGVVLTFPTPDMVIDSDFQGCVCCCRDFSSPSGHHGYGFYFCLIVSKYIYIFIQLLLYSFRSLEKILDYQGVCLPLYQPPG